jgi:nitrate/nitrite transporter NarK
MMNLFARALGGMLGDASGLRWGLKGRSYWLGAVLLTEGIALAAFGGTTALAPAVAVFMLFGVFVCMGCGATYAVTPFINRNGVGARLPGSSGRGKRGCRRRRVSPESNGRDSTAGSPDAGPHRRRRCGAGPAHSFFTS